MNEGAGAHRAWLERDVEGALLEAPRAERMRGGANRDHFGVRGRILVGLAQVEAFGEAKTVGPNDDAADRHFAERRSAVRQDQRFAHPLFVCHCCAPGKIRTYDFWFRRPALYPTELRARGLTN